MNDLSFGERIKTIIDIISSSSLFITLLLITIITIVLLILNQKIKKPIFKILLGILYLGFAVFILVNYGTYILKVGDNFIDQLFKVIYFPSMITYISSVLIAIILMIISIISNKMNKIFKICSGANLTILLFLFILVVDTINRENLMITEKIDLYSSESLTVLVQASMSIFSIWIFILIMNFIVNFITEKIDLSVEKAHKDIKLEENDFKAITHNEYEESFNNYKSKRSYKLLNDALNNDKKDEQ